MRFCELTGRALKHAEPLGKGVYHYRMNILKAQFDNVPAEEIKPGEIDAWLESHSEWSTASRDRYLALMKLVYRLAEYDGKIEKNPLRKVRQKKENNARDRYLNQHEPAETGVDWLKDCTTEESRLRAVIAHDYPEHMAEYVIALETGMRRSEQYGATWENVNFFTGKLFVPKSKHGEARHVKLNSRVKAALQMVKPTPARGRVHADIKSPRHWFEAAVKKAGVTNFTWHCLRHTFCSWLVMNGVDILTVSKLAGHKSIMMTMRYSHLAPSILDEACEKTVAPTATLTATEPKSTEQEQQVSIQ